MKIKPIKYLFIAILIIGISGYGQFKAKMVFYSGNAERSCIIYASGLNYRYEFDENNQQSIVVVKNDSKEILVLMPQQKMAIRSGIQKSISFQ